MLSNTYTLSYVLGLWRESPLYPSHNPHYEKYLGAALRLYVIPHIDPKIGQLDSLAFSTYSDSLRIDQLKDALSAFDCEFNLAVEQGKTAKSTGKNYRAALKKLVLWLEQQPWWKGLFSASVVKVLPKHRSFPSRAKKPKGLLTPISLQVDDLPQHLLKEITEFEEFRLTGGMSIPRTINHQSRLGQENALIRRPKLDPLKVATFQREKKSIFYFLGWYCQCYPNREISLELLTNLDLLEEFVEWTILTRKINYSTGVQLTNIAIAIAKFLNYSQTTRRNWSDIALIRELRNLRNEYQEEYDEEKKETMVEKWEKKELSHGELREVVDYLRTLCAERVSRKNRRTGQYTITEKRNLSAIISDWQNYLFVKIFTYCPVRQEEIRNWALGESLFRKVDDNGNPFYAVALKEHKLDRTGRVRHYPLPSIMTDDLDVWLFHWRPLIVESCQSLDAWMKFWGYSSDVIERIQRKIENAQQGIFPDKVRVVHDVYIQKEKQILAATQRRLDFWSSAKVNLETHNLVFFSLGQKYVEVCGKPLQDKTVWTLVSTATANATHALFGEAKWINPHAFRHIAEKHLRLIGKTHLADAFGALIGHSKEMGDEYANQILSEYDITKDIVDNWWLDN